MSTKETGLDWIIFSTSHQVGWIECILSITGWENIYIYIYHMYYLYIVYIYIEAVWTYSYLYDLH